ncbi:hypothetical protein GCM10022389_27660 [Flavobacterium cheonanense]|uniref:Secretion system C-terminal sorting domain-containing protein n=1 Tax=Flavobacterium cheonanense TaxID=706183 RepID=A0ABP7W337_9FLAO
MKKIIFIFLLIISFQNNLNAQNPINVIITGECSYASGTYTYNGQVNGKNNYTQTFVIDGESVVIGVGFDNVKWVLYAEGDLTDDGFSNIAVPTGLLPPFTGWVNTGCLDGTMIIDQNLSTNDFESFNGKILIYPNPTNNFITIKNKENSSEYFKYKIFDLTGRNIISGNSKFNEQINVESLTIGNYLIQLETENGQKSTKKLIKN